MPSKLTMPVCSQRKQQQQAFCLCWWLMLRLKWFDTQNMSQHQVRSRTWYVDNYTTLIALQCSIIRQIHFCFFVFFFGWSVSIQSIITPLQFRLTTDLQITRWGCYTNSATESHQHKCWLETDIPPSIWFHLNHWQRVLSLKAEFVYFITVLWSFVICFFYLPNLINPVDSCLCIPPSFVLGTKQTIFL